MENIAESLRPFPTAILDPKVDPIFKSLFTNNSDESRFALKSFLSAIFDERVSKVVIDQNELPIESEKDKQSIFDLTCHLGDEEKVLNIEMQGWNSKNSFDNRSEYHVSHLLNHFVKKGMDWDQVPQAFMISVMNFIYDDEDRTPNQLFYSMKNQRNKKLKSQKLNIIYIELPKFVSLSEKTEDLINLTSIQRWAKFFLNVNKQEKTNLIEEIAKMDKGIMAAKTVISRISQEEAEWRRERNYWDAISNEITIRNRAIREGHAEGLAKGHAEGLAEGHAEGLAEGIAKGIAKGHSEGISEGISIGERNLYIKQIFNKLEKNKSPEIISEEIELPLDETMKLIAEINEKKLKNL